MNRVQKMLFLFAAAALFALVSACKAESTVILNSEYKIYYGGCQIEATVREMTVDGGTTTARVHFLNLGSDELPSLEALVEFVDVNGDTVESAVIDETFDPEIAVGDSFSVSASCASNEKIVGVVVTDYAP